MHQTQDGGNSGEERELSLPTKEERFGMSKVELMPKTDTSLPTTDTERSTNNSMLSMLTNGRAIQRRVNSTKSTDSTLKETSTSFPICHKADISISLTTETW